MGNKETQGALITGVENGSPEDKAGFKGGDLVTEMNGKKNPDIMSLRTMVVATVSGTRVNFKIIRNGEEQSITATPASIIKKNK